MSMPYPSTHDCDFLVLAAAGVRLVALPFVVDFGFAVVFVVAARVRVGVGALALVVSAVDVDLVARFLVVDLVVDLLADLVVDLVVDLLADLVVDLVVDLLADLIVDFAALARAPTLRAGLAASAAGSYAATSARSLMM